MKKRAINLSLKKVKTLLNLIKNYVVPIECKKIM